MLATHRTGPRLANRLLAVYFLIFGGAMARVAGHATGYFAAHPHFALVLVPFELLYGPLFFWYVRLMTGHRLVRRDLRHLLPAIAMAVALTPFFFWPAERKAVFLATPTPLEKRLTLVVWIVNWTVLTLYLVAAMRELRLHGERLRRNLSTIGRAGLTWLRAMAWVIVAGQVVDVLATLFTFRDGVASPWWALSAFALVIVLYVFAFFALRQPELRYAAAAPMRLDPTTGEWARPTVTPEATAVVVPLDVDADEADRAAGKYQRSGLGEAEATAIAERITALLDGKRLHVQTDLSLADLAALVGAPTHHVSQVLNERLGGSFFEVINQRRVAEAQRMLADPKKAHLSVLTIAYDAGFNSKTAFNTAFKAATGTTPSAYRKAHLPGA